MIYLDSSSLLKLLWNEPESSAVIDAIAAETGVVVSELAEMETSVQLKAAYLGGDYTLPRWRRLEAQLAAMEELKVSRLMTHDEGQSKAAVAAGFEVVRPGHV